MKWLVMVVAALLIAGCNPVASEKAAEEAVAAFHKAMDARQYEAIYDGSADDLKSTTSRDDFVKMLGVLHSKLGTYASGETVKLLDNVDLNSGIHSMTLARRAQFERGLQTEEFVFHVEGRRALLVSYQVPSRLLVG